MNLTLAASLIAAGLIFCSLGAVAWRLLAGPSAADRLIAADMLGLLAICIAATTAIVAGDGAYLDIAFGIATVGFLGAVAFAGLLERGSVAKEDGA